MTHDCHVTQPQRLFGRPPAMGWQQTHSNNNRNHQTDPFAAPARTSTAEVRGHSSTTFSFHELFENEEEEDELFYRPFGCMSMQEPVDDMVAAKDYMPPLPLEDLDDDATKVRHQN